MNPAKEQLCGFGLRRTLVLLLLNSTILMLTFSVNAKGSVEPIPWNPTCRSIVYQLPAVVCCMIDDMPKQLVKQH